MKEAVKKVRGLVNFLKDSSSARVSFQNIMIASGLEPLAIIKGTTNRWFFKYSEVHRALLLKDSINTFLESYENLPDKLEVIKEEDWDLLLVYENAMRSIVDAAKVLEGELFPSASSVIPFLDAIFEELRN